MLGRRKKAKVAAPKPQMTLALFFMPRVTYPKGSLVSDAEDYIFDAILKRIGHLSAQTIPDPVLKASDKAINMYIRNYGMVIVMRDHSGNSLVYSANYRNSLPEAFTNGVRETLDILPDEPVLWASDVYVTPRTVPAREVIWGERLSGPPKPPRKTVRQRWAHPEQLTPEELDYLMGRSKEPPKP